MRFTATISREVSGEEGDQVHQLNGGAAYFFQFVICTLLASSPGTLMIGLSW